MHAVPHHHRSRKSANAALANALATGAARLMRRLLPALAGLGFCAGASAQAVNEHQVKAAFLYNFTRFVEWPEQRFAAPDDTLVIGVFGSDAIMKPLEELVANRRTGTRRIAVVQVDNLSQVESLHLLFIPASEHDSFVRAWPQLKHRALLTVTDAQPCSTVLAHICFAPIDNKLRFEIDMGAAARSRLRVNSQLQKLATVVRRDDER